MKNITAQMVVKNGTLTINHSILSIIDVVDYIYVVDHGSNDDTVSIVHNLMDSYDNIRFFDGSKLSYAECRNLVICMSPSKYILKWDADFVALRKKYGAPTDFEDLIFQVLNEMNNNNLNLCLFLAHNIGFTFNCIDKSRELEGIHGDIRMYKRTDFCYKTGDQYSDEFVPKIPARRLYMNKVGEDPSPISILHFNQLKSLYSFGLRDQLFEYDRLKALGEVHLSFEDWLITVKGIKNVTDYIISKVRYISKNFAFSDKFSDLYNQDFYRIIFDKSPFVVNFDDNGSVECVNIK